MSIELSKVVARATEESARAGAVRPWPGVLLGDDHDAAVSSLAAALGELPDGIADALAERLGAAGDLGLGALGALWAAELAVRSGWRPSAIHGPAIEVSRDGAAAWLLPVVVPAPSPDRDRVRALEGRLAPIFDGRPWALVLRGPLPPNADLERLLEPVRLWLVAVDRGRWDGDYAIYEDDHLNVELRLLDGPRGAPSGPRLRVPHRGALAALQVARSGLIQTLADAAPPADMPVVAVFVRGERWDLAPSSLREVTLGKLHEYVSDGRARSLTFASDSAGWFAEPELAAVTAAWWLGADPADPTRPRGRAHENPWSRYAGNGPTFPGARLSVAVTGDPDAESVPATLQVIDADEGEVRP